MRPDFNWRIRGAGSLSFIVLLSALVVASAFAVVAVRHQNRVAFYELEKLQKQRDQFAIEWRQFQAELATWRAEHNIESEARATRKMLAPDLLAIETIRLPEAAQ